MSDTPRTVEELIEEAEEWGPLPFAIKNRLYDLERELEAAQKRVAELEAGMRKLNAQAEPVAQEAMPPNYGPIDESVAEYKTRIAKTSGIAPQSPQRDPDALVKQLVAHGVNKYLARDMVHGWLAAPGREG